MVPAKYKPKPGKNRFYILLFVGILLFLWFSLSYILSRFSNPDAFRVGIAILSQPVLVISWSPRNNTLVAMRLPGDARVHVAYGYGMYSISSLSDLDRVENKHGQLVTKTLEDLVGFPIQYYVREKQEGSVLDDSDRLSVQSFFSLPSLFRMVQGHIETNIPFFSFLHFYRAFGNIPTSALTSYDFVKRNVVAPLTLPDGSEDVVIDTSKLDIFLGNVLEDERLRKENFRIEIVNATLREGLAQHVARILDKSGLQIVSLGNSDTPLDTCRIQGHRAVKDSLTVRFIEYALGKCLFEENDDTSIDATITVGDAWAKRY